MYHSIQHIGAALKAFRQKKGLTQRALSVKIGVPQSHISKIENGAVDLQVSSLIEFARALDLELMLVPRTLVPTFQAIQKGDKIQESTPLYRLEDEDDDG